MANLKKNYIYNVLYQLLIVILPFITAPYIARVLGAEKTGIYSYTYSIAYYFTLIAKLGIENYGNRSIAKVRNNQEELNRTFSSIYTLQVIMTVLVIICYIIYSFLFAKKNLLIVHIQILWLISVFFDINWFFFGIEEFKITVVRNTIAKVLCAVFILICVKKIDDLWIYTIIMSGGTLIANVSIWPFLKNRVKFVKPKVEEVFQHFKPNLILFIPVVAISVYTLMDKIMLGKMTDMFQVGVYEYAEKILVMPKGVIGALGTVMLPRIANMIATGQKNKSQNFLEISMAFVMFLSFAFAFGLAGISSTFVPIFYGTGFNESSILLKGLSFTIPFYAWGNVIRTQYLLPKGEDKPYVISVILGAIVNAIANSLLINRFLALGAVWGTILAEISLALYQTYAVSSNLDIKRYIKNSGAFFIFGIIMYIVVKLIGNVMEISVRTLVIQVIVGAIVYLTLSLVYLLISKNVLINLIRKKI